MRCTPRPVSTAGEGQGGRLTRRLICVPPWAGGFRLHPQLTLSRSCSRGCSAPRIPCHFSESPKSSGEILRKSRPPGAGQAGLGMGRAWTSETSGPLQLSSPEPGPELRTPITAEPS